MAVVRKGRRGLGGRDWCALEKSIWMSRPKIEGLGTRASRGDTLGEGVTKRSLSLQLETRRKKKESHMDRPHKRSLVHGKFETKVTGAGVVGKWRAKTA